jgi:hypothetical protein
MLKLASYLLFLGRLGSCLFWDNDPDPSGLDQLATNHGILLYAV